MSKSLVATDRVVDDVRSQVPRVELGGEADLLSVGCNAAVFEWCTTDGVHDALEVAECVGSVGLPHADIAHALDERILACIREELGVDVLEGLPGPAIHYGELRGHDEPGTEVSLEIISAGVGEVECSVEFRLVALHDVRDVHEHGPVVHHVLSPLCKFSERRFLVRLK